MKFACFGGAAAVADEAVAVARHSSGRKFFFGSRSPSRSKASSSSETKTKRIMSPGRRESDFDVYDTIAAGKSPSSPSALSTAASLDSAYSTSSSSSCSYSYSSSRSSSSSSLSSLLKATPPPQPAKRQRPDEQRRSPAVGAAAVLVCLIMMTFGGRLAATLLTAAVLCFFPRRPRAPSPERPSAASRREAVNTKAVVDKFNILLFCSLNWLLAIPVTM